MILINLVLKRLLSIIVVCFIVIGMFTIPIYAQTNDFSAECLINGDEYNILGKAESDYVNVVLMPADTDVENFSSENFDQSGYVYFSVKNNNGTFSKSFELPNDFSDGEYKSVVWDNAEQLELYFIVGDEAYKNTLISNKIKDDKLDEVIERYGHLFDIDIENHNNLKSSVKKAVAGKLGSVKITDFEKQYSESVLSSLFENLETNADVYTLLKMIGVDLDTYYNKLNDDIQQKVLTKLLNNLPDSIEKMKELAELYSEEAYQEQNNPSSTGQNRPGSSTGGNGSGFKPGSVVANISGPVSNFSNNQSLSEVQKLSDISNHWAKESITELFKMGIVSGSTDGNFYPENNVSRAEFAKMLAGVIGIDALYNAEKTFSDVNSTSWYYGYIMALCNHGIMKGYTDNEFRPDNSITRQEMATAIYRFLESRDFAMDDETEFSDINDASEYAKDAILKLGGLGLIVGTDGKFRPVDNLSRAETATVMLRIYNKLNNLDTDDISFVSKDNLENQLSFLVTEKLTTSEARVKEAEALIPKLLNRSLRGVTRAGFLSDVYDLSINVALTPNEQYFTDLPLSRAETASVQAAVDNGFIEKTEEFRPDDIITGYDALGAMLCALGYKDYANLKGGWPAGYIDAAQKAGLMEDVPKNIALSEPLDEDAAKVMLLNMLSSRAAITIGTVDGEKKLTVSDETLLENIHKVFVSTGIVRETNLNSLDKIGINKQKNVIIGNSVYTVNDDNDYSSYLGYSVNAYYKKDNKLLMLAKTQDNEIVTFPIDRAILDSNLTVKYDYYEKNRTYKYKLNDDYSLLYNGALSTKTLKSVVDTTSDATIELLDNNDDGTYDIVTIKRPEYVLVSGISKINRLVYDKNSSENVINLDDENVVFHIEGRNGDIRFLDVASDELYEMYSTEDKQLVDLKLMNKTVVGNASAMGDDSITVNDVDYKTTEYFNKYYLERFVLGNDYSFTLSSSGRIIGFSESGTDMVPGYITNVLLDDGKSNKNLVIEMYTQNNKFESYNIDKNKRVMVDGVMTNTNDLYNMLMSGSVVNDQLVFYRADENKNLKAIDFSQLNSEGNFGEIKKDADSLTEYVFDTTSFLYRSTGELMYPNFNISGSIVFIVPNDITNEEGFYVTSSAFFSDIKRYSNIRPYNISKNGSAEVVVYHSDNAVPEFSSNSGSLVVEKMVNALNSDGEASKKISGWVDTQYKSYMLDEDVSIYKASGEQLGFGDVIRFYADGDVIKSLVCDFDANESVFARNNDPNASDMNGGYSSFMYQFGEAYYAGENYIYIGGGADGKNLSNSALRNFTASTKNIAIIDLNNQSVRTGTLEDIKTYKNFGCGDFVLIRQRNLITMAIYVYVK